MDVAFSLPGGPARVAANEAALLNTFETRIPSENGGSVGLTVESIAFEPTTDPEKPALIGHLVTNVSSVFEMTKPDVFAEVPDGYFVRKPTVSLADDAMTGSLRSPVFRENWATAEPSDAAFTITVADGIRGVELTPFRLLDGFGTGAKALAATPDALDLSLPTLLGMLVLAVIGGFILNFMPCVLPVLSLKMFSVVSHGGQADRKIRLSFAATAAGILVSFLILALIFASLKLAGASFGWGVQFTQPIFILALLVVLLGFALNLFGLFEIPNIPGLGGLGGKSAWVLGGLYLWHPRNLARNPVLRPPSLGTAIGFALAAPVMVLILIFMFVGVGLALPYLAVIAFPKLASVMPKPGRWMLRLRQVLGLAFGGYSRLAVGLFCSSSGGALDLIGAGLRH